MNDPDILTYLLTSMNRSIYAGNVSDNNYPLDFSNNELSLYENVTLAIFLICLDLLTVVGNSFVVLAIIFDLHLRSPTHYLMGSLAIADFLIGMVILPFSSFQLFFNSWPFGSVFCTIWKSNFLAFFFYLLTNKIVSIVVLLVYWSLLRKFSKNDKKN